MQRTFDRLQKLESLPKSCLKLMGRLDSLDTKSVIFNPQMLPVVCLKLARHRPPEKKKPY